MSQGPFPNHPVTSRVVMQPTESNGLGLAGFIVSLGGLVTCGFASPIGLILSLIGLTKRPKGMAIAGSILGAIGTAWLVLAGYVLVLGFFGIGKAVSGIAQTVATQQAGQQAAVLIHHQQSANDNLPSDEQGTTAIASEHDAWGQPMHYERRGTSFVIISAGPDKKFGTGDDITMTEQELIGASAVTTTNTSGNP